MTYPRPPANCTHRLIEWAQDCEMPWIECRVAYGGDNRGPYCDLERHPVLMHVTYNDRSSADCCHDVSRVPVTFCPECGERLPRREPLRGD